MKKFLTVLLALSVVFTYTVGTAFAAVPSDTQKASFNEMLKKAQDSVKTTFEGTYGNAVNLIEGDNNVGTKYYVKAAEAYKAEQLGNIVARGNEMRTGYANNDEYFGVGTTPDYEGAIYHLIGNRNNYDSDGLTENYNNVDGLKNEIITEVKDDAAEKALADVKKASLEILDHVDLSMFSKDIQTIGKKETSYFAIADEHVEYLKSEVARKANVKGYDNAVGAIVEINNDMAWHIANLNDAYKGYTLSDNAIKSLGLKTMEDEGKYEAALKAAKAQKLAQVQAKASTVLSDLVNEPNFNTEVVPTVDAYLLSQKYLIDAAETIDDLEKITIPKSLMKTDVLANVEAVKELDRIAAKYKLAVDASGNLIKDANKIDDAVTEAKMIAYMHSTTLADAKVAVNTAIEKITLGCNAAEALTTYKVEEKKAEIEKAREAALDKEYYAPEAEKVNALYDALLDKVAEAKTDDDLLKIDPVNDVKAKLAKIAKKADVMNSVKALDSFGIAYDKLEVVKNYVNEEISKNYSDAWYDFSNYDEDFFADFFAERGVRAEADITADLYAQAKAEMLKAATYGELAKARAEVEAKIAALPEKAKITFADKAAIKAAWEAAKAYEDKYGEYDFANETKLNEAISQVLKAEVYEANKIVKDLPAKLTVADKATVKEYKAALEVILADADAGMYPANAAATEVADCKAKLAEIRDLECAAVVDAIKALPLNITMADKAAVEAARAAYDAFAKEYTLYADTTFASKYNPAAEYAVGDKYMRLLGLAEASIKALVAEENAKVVEAVKGTHMAIGSSAAKGYIRISWKQKVTDVALDGVEVYRSTKKTTGFAKISTFKKQTAKKYTANLKKGTKYYYYVKGYKMVDGVKVYTHKSITVGRTFR